MGRSIDNVRCLRSVITIEQSTAASARATAGSTEEAFLTAPVQFVNYSSDSAHLVFAIHRPS